ncbi:hypothetical protein M495_14650 [Serratia liquefaciens ATCC 27592]|uniref:hypothetical protein n=1 Tax=Serratia liquefaciens TaxID=614 RepID=UPI0003585BBF|nr:hypothetical protein [Serratia liquefaciens]AGQ31644.1 hypothetical protein M495_14650 [Serratia liquefaciens ATCC 27592]
MEVDYLLIEADKTASIHRAERNDNVVYVPQVNNQDMEDGKEPIYRNGFKTYGVHIHKSGDGNRYLVGVSGGQIDSHEIDQILFAIKNKPAPL